MHDTRRHAPFSPTTAAHRAAAPRARALRAIGSTRPVALVERGPELRALNRCLQDVAAGTGALAIVEAPAGHGKSALLDVVERRTRDAGWTVCRTGHAPDDRSCAFGLLRGLLDAAGAAVPEASPPAAIAALPTGGALPPDIDASAVASAVHSFVRTLAEQRSLALIVDDGHHADDASLAVLAALARRAPDLPLLIVIASRPGPASAAADVLGSFAGARGLVALEPGRLSEDASAELVRSWIADATEETCARTHAAAGGDPWLTTELCRQIHRHGPTILDAPVERLRLSRPGRLAIRRRLAELPDDGRRTADALAVLGGEGDHHDLAAIAGLPVQTLGPVHATLEAAGLCDGGWRFVHPLVEAGVLEQIGAADRERLHRAAAQVLLGRNASERRVAGHFLHAGPAGDGDVSAALRKAATDATADGALVEAASYIERALDERAPGEDRAGLLTELGTLAFHAGLPDVRPRLHEALAATDDDGARVEVLGRLAALQVIDPREDSLELLEEAVASDAPPEVRLAAEIAQLDSLILFPDRGAERARRTLALDPSTIDDDVLRRSVLAHHAWLGAETGDLDAPAVLRLAHAALEGGTLVRHAAHRAAYHLATRVLIAAGDDRGAARAIGRLRAEATECGSPRLAAAAGWYAAELALRRGDLAAAEREATGALDAVQGLNGVSAGVLELLVEALVDRGEHGLATDLLAEHEQLWSGDSGWEIGVRHARARLLLATGDYRAAEDEAREAGRLRVAQGRPNPAWTGWRATLALALAHQGRFEEAIAVADEEVELARRFGAAHALGRALHARAVSEQDHEARAALARAALDEVPDPGALVRARLQIVLGDALVRWGARVEAREPLRSAFESTDRLGAATDAAEARRILVASGLRPRTSAVSGVASLTPRQRQICDLVAAGRSNRAIAQELFLSIKTVETHLATSYQKLAVSGRRELAGLLDGSAVESDDDALAVA